MTPTDRAEALFASTLQPSENPTPAQVAAAVRFSVIAHSGIGGCADILAAEYGKAPEVAAERMRWALSLTRPVAHLAAVA